MGTKTGNRHTAAQKAVASARAGQRGHRTIMIIGGAIIVALIAAIAISVITAMNDGDKSGADGPLVVPATATADGGLAVGNGPVDVDIYLDYMCPYCGKFEAANHADIQRLIDDGTATVNLHPLAFLDKASQGTEYSTRAANAVATVADKDPGHVLNFNTALFENQPEENSEGLDDAKIAEVAASVGVPQSVTDTFADRTFVPWVTQSNDAAFENGITGTPTVKINGVVTEVDLYTAGPLYEAVTAAAGTTK
ncbi:protein-disulfide isomerase [Actinoplanes campanulatus]|uniref:Protein-disulfide isomerase n=1 Tax=Actinoplanes campanulatus TaxID=113559 RepID=A0A7W5AHX0_9ACTN|nr:thioredoxin domain-containing protein [Actinoplanes campanulatus]MBB3096395.1 protein-disulfide isomerase [Actinoplanes campanulatus]GGN18630.1 membrane protein [Actinoplanes campanulatus]GID38461.1 membrane protein [Actinoplanes campanulatus]